MNLTRDQFLKRCETIYDSGLVRDVAQFFATEERRLGGFIQGRTLAGDHDGYDVVKAVAILTHPCQACAEDKEAWHTRPAFCDHKKAKVKR